MHQLKLVSVINGTLIVLKFNTAGLVLIFPAVVKLSKPYVGEGKLKRSIQSGMNATAEVKTGDRRIIDFILSPIAKASKEAARER